MRVEVDAGMVEAAEGVPSTAEAEETVADADDEKRSHRTVERRTSMVGRVQVAGRRMAGREQAGLQLARVGSEVKQFWCCRKRE